MLGSKLVPTNDRATGRDIGTEQIAEFEAIFPKANELPARGAIWRRRSQNRQN